MNTRKFIQFNMWKNCNNNCRFCFNRGQKKSDTLDKLEILRFVKNKLLHEDILQFNEIGFIGGEFFDIELDDEQIKTKFYELFNICKTLYDNGTLEKICIATHLIYDINIHLIPFIKFLKEINLFDITLFCTSYDTVYRFKNTKDCELWKSNMLYISKNFNTKIHTEVIITKNLIEQIESNIFDILEFEKTYNTKIDFIEPTFIEYFSSKAETLNKLPDFFPSRSQFIDFIYKYAINLKIIDLQRFLSIKLRSDRSYYKLDSGKWIQIDNRWTTGVRRVDKNGIPQLVYSYSDSDKNMIDDVEELRSSQ